MEFIKTIIIVNLEFCKLERSFVAFVLGVPVLAWAVGFLFGDSAFVATFNTAIIAGLIGGVIAFFLVPILVKSNMKEVNYKTDWIFHVFFSLVGTAYCFLVAWPLLSHMSAVHDFF